MQPSLFLGRDGRVKSPRDVPADNAADNGPLADALRGAAASQPCRVMQSAHKTHGVILRGCDAFSIGGFSWEQRRGDPAAPPPLLLRGRSCRPVDYRGT